MLSDSRKSSIKSFITYNNELIKGTHSKDDYSAKTFVHNNLLQIFIVLHYFEELIAISMRQDMVGETVDSIPVKEGRVEITFLFQSICLMLQCCFYQQIVIPYTLNLYCLIFFLCYAFFHGKIQPKIMVHPCTLIASF